VLVPRDNPSCFCGFSTLKNPVIIRIVCYQAYTSFWSYNNKYLAESICYLLDLSWADAEASFKDLAEFREDRF
jgi:hypothetical protein